MNDLFWKNEVGGVRQEIQQEAKHSMEDWVVDTNNSTDETKPVMLVKRHESLWVRKLGRVSIFQKE